MPARIATSWTVRQIACGLVGLSAYSRQRVLSGGLLGRLKDHVLINPNRVPNVLHLLYSLSEHGNESLSSALGNVRANPRCTRPAGSVRRAVRVAGYLSISMLARRVPTVRWTVRGWPSTIAPRSKPQPPRRAKQVLY